MSQLIINRLLKPSLCKNVITHNKKVRMFCSKPTNPYMLIDRLLNNTTQCSNDEVHYDGEYKDKLVIKDKKLQDDVREAMTVGFTDQDGSWRVKLEKSEDDDSTRRLVLVDNTTSDSDNPMKHHLPPLHSSSRIQNVAISNDPDIEKKDLVVAVKFLGSHVSLFKPFSDDSGSGWININTSGSVHPFSSLMYSKVDKKFLTVSLSGEHIWYLDLDFEEKKNVHPEFEYLCHHENKEDPLQEIFPCILESSIWCSRTDHLVESPSGQHFLVKWFCGEDWKEDKHKMFITRKPEDFLVFRFDKFEDNLIYTRDIGDFCIFLGHSQAFCVKASSYPGLRRNSIYYVGSNFGIHDIATTFSTTFHDEDGVPLRSTEFPYWPPPFSY